MSANRFQNVVDLLHVGVTHFAECRENLASEYYEKY